MASTSSHIYGRVKWLLCHPTLINIWLEPYCDSMYLYWLFLVPILPVVQCSTVWMYFTHNVSSFTDFKKSLEAALAKGSVEVEVLKCVTLGPTEAGKTQLKSALIGNFDRSSESTPMSTGAEAVMQRYVRGKSTWEPLTRERLCKSLHTTVKKKMFTESSSPSPTKANTQRNEAQALGVEAKKIEPLKIGMRGGTGVHEDATGALEHRADSKEGLRRQFAAIKASVQEELKEAGTAEMKGLDKVRIIHIVDSGGTTCFLRHPPSDCYLSRCVPPSVQHGGRARS